jgi:hypothetical protein
MNRQQFIARCHIIHKRNLHWRFGQTVMNVAINNLTQKAMPLVATDVDCFYDNDRIPAFLDALFPPEHDQAANAVDHTSVCVRVDCPVCGGPE